MVSKIARKAKHHYVYAVVFHYYTEGEKGMGPGAYVTHTASKAFLSHADATEYGKDFLLEANCFEVITMRLMSATKRKHKPAQAAY